MAVATAAASSLALHTRMLSPPTSARTAKHNRTLTSRPSSSLSTNFLSPFPAIGSVYGDFFGLRLRLDSLNPASLSLSKPKRGVVAMGESMADKWKQTALLVIDMQKDFILEDRTMRVKGGLEIVPNCIKTVEIARQRGILVVWVVREHDYFGRDVEIFRRHFYSPEKGGPATPGSEGAEMVDGLVVKKEDYKLVKTRFSAFFDTNLHTFLQSNGINNLVVIGIQTPNCIRQTVFDAVSHDYRSVAVIVDATAAATPEVHHANLFDMKNIGVATPTLKEWAETNA